MKGFIAAILFVLAATSASAFVTIESWWTPEETFADSFVETAISLDIDELGSDEDIKVTFSIPELGIRASRGPYDPVSTRTANVHRALWIPDDAEPGEYVIRMYASDKHGNKHVRHRFVEID
jgi:hypothetical protein